MKRTEPLILTVRFLVFDREPYRTKSGTVIRLLLRIANRTASKWRIVIPLYLRTANRTTTILMRYGTRSPILNGWRCPYWCGTVRGQIVKSEPYRINMGAVNRLLLRTVPIYILVRYGSRSNTKKRTVKINGSVSFTLLTVRLKNGTVTAAIVVKNAAVNKRENGTVRSRCGTPRKR